VRVSASGGIDDRSALARDALRRGGAIDATMLFVNTLATQRFGRQHRQHERPARSPCQPATEGEQRRAAVVALRRRPRSRTPRRR
jgi:hypothetical protein